MLRDFLLQVSDLANVSCSSSLSVSTHSLSSKKLLILRIRILQSVSFPKQSEAQLQSYIPLLALETNSNRRETHQARPLGIGRVQSSEDLVTTQQETDVTSHDDNLPIFGGDEQVSDSLSNLQVVIAMIMTRIGMER
jgi:hypothetical protein